MSSLQRLSSILAELFQNASPTDRDLRQVFALRELSDGQPLAEVAKRLRLQPRALGELAKSGAQENLQAVYSNYSDRTNSQELLRRRRGIAQMLLGTLGEKRFEDIVEDVTGAGVLQIEDHRPSRSDTDYRLLNGSSKPVCRFNIKFHGTLFRDAFRYVKLQPEDCFALATYKIANALKRQELERLPYVFLVLSVPDVKIDDVANLIPDEYVWALAVVGGKRKVEELIVERLCSEEYIHTFDSVLARMPDGQFRIISVKRAYDLLIDKLFERVHALSLKSFTSRFRNAEVDMHFSLSQDMTPVREFLEILKKESPQKFAVRLYIGDY